MKKLRSKSSALAAALAAPALALALTSCGSPGGHCDDHATLRVTTSSTTGIVIGDGESNCYGAVGTVWGWVTLEKCIGVPTNLNGWYFCGGWQTMDTSPKMILPLGHAYLNPAGHICNGGLNYWPLWRARAWLLGTEPGVYGESGDSSYIQLPCA